MDKPVEIYCEDIRISFIIYIYICICSIYDEIILCTGFFLFCVFDFCSKEGVTISVIG